MKSESEVARLVLLLATPWTAAYQAPPSMGFSINAKVCFGNLFFSTPQSELKASGQRIIQ